MEHKNWLSPFGNSEENSRVSPLIPEYFNDFFNDKHFGPSIDLHEDDRSITLTAEIPGIKQEDLDITVNEHTVILKGETKRSNDRAEQGYRLSERHYGSFYRTISLPDEVIPQQAVAKYKNGVLELQMPKADIDHKKGFKPKLEMDDDKQ